MEVMYAILIGMYVPVHFKVWFVVLNATFNNISVISWRSVLLVEETRVPGEKHKPVAIY
jgi:hypothetical protein